MTIFDEKMPVTLMCYKFTGADLGFWVGGGPENVHKVWGGRAKRAFTAGGSGGALWAPPEKFLKTQHFGGHFKAYVGTYLTVYILFNIVKNTNILWWPCLKWKKSITKDHKEVTEQKYIWLFLCI